MSNVADKIKTEHKLNQKLLLEIDSLMDMKNEFEQRLTHLERQSEAHGNQLQIHDQQIESCEDDIRAHGNQFQIHDQKFKSCEDDIRAHKNQLQIYDQKFEELESKIQKITLMFIKHIVKPESLL